MVLHILIQPLLSSSLMLICLPTIVTYFFFQNCLSCQQWNVNFQPLLVLLLLGKNEKNEITFVFFLSVTNCPSHLKLLQGFCISSPIYCIKGCLFYGCFGSFPFSCFVLLLLQKSLVYLCFSVMDHWCAPYIWLLFPLSHF